MAGQACGELETSAAATSSGQGLVALGGDMGSWELGRAVGSSRGLGRDSQGWGSGGVLGILTKPV